MKDRCLNSRNKRYEDYGGRGITVCERWLRFENFYEDMGDRPDGKSLDRYPDPNGNYEPSNCRWATPKEQQLNRRMTRYLTYQNQTLPLAVWAERFGIKSNVVRGRIVGCGWEIEKALTTPVRKAA